LFKINRLFLIRDAKLKMYQKKKSSNSRFSTSFFSGETENKINFDIITEYNSNLNNFKESYWEKIFSFPNFSVKACLAAYLQNISNEKNS
jgi:hypothetical protein